MPILTLLVVFHPVYRTEDTDESFVASGQDYGVSVMINYLLFEKTTRNLAIFYKEKLCKDNPIDCLLKLSLLVTFLTHVVYMKTCRYITTIVILFTYCTS